MEGCGYTLELARNKNLKVECRGVTLENKPTTDKNTDAGDRVYRE